MSDDRTVAAKLREAHALDVKIKSMLKEADDLFAVWKGYAIAHVLCLLSMAGLAIASIVLEKFSVPIGAGVGTAWIGSIIFRRKTNQLSTTVERLLITIQHTNQELKDIVESC